MIRFLVQFGVCIWLIRESFTCSFSFNIWPNRMDTRRRRRRRQNIIIKYFAGFVVAVAYTISLLHVHDVRIRAIAINESHKHRFRRSGCGFVCVCVQWNSTTTTILFQPYHTVLTVIQLSCVGLIKMHYAPLETFGARSNHGRENAAYLWLWSCDCKYETPSESLITSTEQMVIRRLDVVYRLQPHPYSLAVLASCASYN